MGHIAFGRPQIGESERQAVLQVLDGSVLTHGPVGRQFEQAFAAFTGAPHAVSVGSCMAALHLACFQLDLDPGDEVLVPALTHTATAHAAELVGAHTRFVDADPATGNIDLDQLESRITPRTRVLAVVHYLGLPVDMARVMEIARAHGLFVIEDCALALGATCEGRHVGLWGDAGCFSFYPVKHITTGEGGMLTTTRPDVAQRVSHLRAFGIDRTTPAERKVPGMYEVEWLGFNYRLGEMGAALGVTQMARLPDFLARRRANYEALTGYLQRMEGIRLLDAGDERLRHSHYCHTVVLDPALALHRNTVMQRMKQEGVETSCYYPHPVPLMPYYRRRYRATPADFPVATRLCDSSIALPVGPHLDAADMARIAQVLEGVLEEVAQYV